MANQTRLKVNPESNVDLFSYGDNTKSSAEIFRERQKYDSYVFPDFLADNFVSTWTTERYYGLVDTYGNAVTPDPRRLRSLQFGSDEDRAYYALNFVADAWADFCRKVRELVAVNVIYKDSPWANPQVVKAWEPAETGYDLYMRENIYPVLYNNYLYSGDTNTRIRNINDFINEFNNFMRDTMSKVGPVTLSGFIEGNYCPMYSSGLVIEIAGDDYDNDFNKSYKFGDYNFSLICTLAARYGFSVDKNIPWRFVADLRNPVMLEYMLGVPIEEIVFPDVVEFLCDPVVGDTELPPQAFGYSQIPGLADVRRRVSVFTYTNSEGVETIEPGFRRYKTWTGSSWVPAFDTAQQPIVFSTMFRTDYSPSYQTDIDLLQEYLLYFYNYYVSLQGRVATQNLTPFDSDCGPRTTSFLRNTLTPQEFDSMYGDRWKLKTFYIIRNIERLNQLPPRRKVYEIQQILNGYNLSMADDPETAYQRALTAAQVDYIGPADVDPLTLQTVGDIIQR
jgi:hypothetical protein